MAKLNMESPIEEELSFVDETTRKKLGITDETVRKFEESGDVASFDPDQILGRKVAAATLDVDEDGIAEHKAAKKGGKKTPKSFEETDIEKDLGV